MPSWKPPKFDDLVNVVSYCTFVSIQSYVESTTCEIKHKESFCNQFTQTVQQQHGSPLISYLASSKFSLSNIKLGQLSQAKRRFSTCTVWIQYDNVAIPLQFTYLEPNIFILYSELNNLTYNFNGYVGTNKVSWLRTLEPWFSNAVFIIHAEPKSKAISIFCFYYDKLKATKNSVNIIHLTQPLNPVITNFNHKLTLKNLHNNPIVFHRINYISPQSVKLAKQTCYQYPVRFAI